MIQRLTQWLSRWRQKRREATLVHWCDGLVIIKARRHQEADALYEKMRSEGRFKGAHVCLGACRGSHKND